jgi:hypothetical protein
MKKYWAKSYKWGILGQNNIRGHLKIHVMPKKKKQLSGAGRS